MGAGAGVLVAVIIAVVISAIGLPMPPMPNSSVGYTAAIRLSSREILLSFAVGLIGTWLAAIMTAWRASRISIVAALARN
jgi:putative ABC transport system permease protein